MGVLNSNGGKQEANHCHNLGLDVVVESIQDTSYAVTTRTTLLAAKRAEGAVNFDQSGNMEDVDEIKKV